MVKVALISVFALAAAGAASAQTADTPSWSGPYVGGQVGYGFGDGRAMNIGGTSTAANSAIASGRRPAQLNQNREGFVGGGQIGWNFQHGRWVFGPEADFDYTHVRGTASVNTLSAAGQSQNTIVRNRLDWMASARLRAGYTVGDGLIYATGGYAAGKVRGSAAFNGPTGAELYAGRDSYTAQGWLAGIGGELKPFHNGAMSKVSFGLEGTYYDLGRSHVFAGATTAAANTDAYVVGKNMRGFNGVFKVNYAF